MFVTDPFTTLTTSKPCQMLSQVKVVLLGQFLIPTQIPQSHVDLKWHQVDYSLIHQKWTFHHILICQGNVFEHKIYFDTGCLCVDNCWINHLARAIIHKHFKHRSIIFHGDGKRTGHSQITKLEFTKCNLSHKKTLSRMDFFYCRQREKKVLKFLYKKGLFIQMFAFKWPFPTCTNNLIV